MAAEEAEEAVAVEVLGGRGKGKRGRRSESSEMGRRRLSWRRSRTSAMDFTLDFWGFGQWGRRAFI